MSKYLVDVNVLVALTDPGHMHHELVANWFDRDGHRDWGACAFTQAGFMRLMTRPRPGTYSVDDATEMLLRLSTRAGYRYWPVADDWIALAAPFRERVFGHQQITDAWLLGLVIKECGVLVTMDKAVRTMAGPKYAGNVLVLQ